VRHLKIALTRTPVEILAWRRSTFADKGEGKETPDDVPRHCLRQTRSVCARDRTVRAKYAPATSAIALAQ
jgi:hypothetical protein